MKVYSAVIERDPQPGLLVGFVPGFPGAHSEYRSALQKRICSTKLTAAKLRSGIAASQIVAIVKSTPQLSSAIRRPACLSALCRAALELTRSRDAR